MPNPDHIWAPWLRDDRLQFRPPVRADAQSGPLWHEGEPPPMAHTIEASLEDSETVPWGAASTVRLIIGDVTTGETIGGVVIHRNRDAVQNIVITPSRALPASDHGDVETRALSLLTGWLLDDVGVRSILLRIDATRTALAESAATLGYKLAYTLREYAFIDGRFVDVHGFQVLSPRWTMVLAEES